MQDWELVARESVRQTIADYTAGTDGFDLSALAACFTSEGRLDYTGGSGPLIGPSEIEDGLAEQLGTRTEDAQPSFVRHHVSSVRFLLVQPDRIEASSYFTVLTDIGVDHWGRYRDVLVPVEHRWLFASRKIRVDGFAESSLMRPA